MLNVAARSCFFFERQNLLQYSLKTTLTNTIAKGRSGSVRTCNSDSNNNNNNNHRIRLLARELRQAQQQQRQHATSILTRKASKLKTQPEMGDAKPKIIFVLGGPGAGKGTQCAKIVERFGFVHLSAGDLLREERAREGSEVGALIEDYIRNGKIVPVEVTCSLLEAAMTKSGKSKFLIDGFPRNQDNLDGWTRQMSDKVDFQFVLFFDCDVDKCVERCIARGQSGSGRSDDNPESMTKRINTYNTDSLPIIKHFEKLGQVKRIDASPSAEAVFEKVVETFSASGFE